MASRVGQRFNYAVRRLCYEVAAHELPSYGIGRIGKETIHWVAWSYPDVKRIIDGLPVIQRYTRTIHRLNKDGSTKVVGIFPHSQRELEVCDGDLMAQTKRIERLFQTFATTHYYYPPTVNLDRSVQALLNEIHRFNK